MNVVFYALLLIVCFFVLIKGADFLVDSGSYVARAFKVPALVIGLTIIAFGTSAPEAGVSIVSAMQGSNSLAISNVVGSNIINLLIVAGVCALIKAVPVDSDIRKFDYPLYILVSGLLVIVARDGMISRLDGIVLFVLIVVYVAYLIIRSMRHKAKNALIEELDKDEKKDGKPEVITTKRIILNIGIIIASVFAIFLSSKGIVSSCTYFATLLGVSDTIIGLTIVAMGTSLPELVTSLVASKKGESAIAMGNVIGSSIFNILFVLGMSATISPIKLLSANVVDTIICLAITIICLLFVNTGTKIKRSEGAIMVLIFACYMVFAFLREFGMLDTVLGGILA